VSQVSELLVPVLVSAAVTSLVALAFHLVIRTTSGIADFAIGQYVVVGGLASTTMVQEFQVPVPLAVLSGIALASLVALISDVVVFRPLEATWGLRAGAFAAVVGSVALLWIWEQVAGLVFGEAAQRGPSFSEARFIAGDVRATGHDLIVIALAGVVFVSLSVLLERTPLGRLLRATGDSRHSAEVLGLNTGGARASAFLLAGALAGVAGVLVAPLAGLRPSGGTVFTLNGFVALFLGGVATPWGALAGAGLLEATRIVVSRFTGIFWQDYVVLLIALVIFALRPRGILGGTGQN